MMDQCEFLLGRNVYLQFEFLPGVIKYREELKMNKYKHDEEVKGFHPDAEVVLTRNEIANLEEMAVSKMMATNMHMTCRLWFGVRKEITC